MEYATRKSMVGLSSEFRNVKQVNILNSDIQLTDQKQFVYLWLVQPALWV
jgi:hypothetical protein